MESFMDIADKKSKSIESIMSAIQEMPRAKKEELKRVMKSLIYTGTQNAWNVLMDSLHRKD
jgi:hypothetical protein